MIGKADGYSTINKKTSPEELIGKIGSCRTINRETLPSRPRRTDPLDDFRPPTEEGADFLLKDLPILIGKVDSYRTINRETLPNRPRRSDPLEDFRPPA